jgi:hypothetical protein
LFPSPGFHRCCAACFINMHCTFRLPGSIHLQQAVRCCSGFSSEISSGFIYGETILRIFLHQTVAVMLFPKWAAEPCCQDSLRYFTYKLPCLWSAGRLYQDKFWFRPFATVPSALLLPTANLAICNSRLKHLSTGQPYTIYVKFVLTGLATRGWLFFWFQLLKERCNPRVTLFWDSGSSTTFSFRFRLLPVFHYVYLS